jgi:hypothetical protein
MRIGTHGAGSVWAREGAVTPRAPQRRALGLRRLLVAFALTLGALLLSSVPASALSEQGHVFSFAFGSAGSGNGQFAENDPRALAVNEASGDLYVIDQGNGRIQRFGCTSSACTFVSQFKVAGAESLVVINGKGASSGDLFVATEEKVIKKFNAEGKLLATLKGWKEKGGALEEFGEIHGLAELNGKLYVYREANVLQLSGTTAVKQIPTEALCLQRPGFALGPDESVYVGTERVNFSGICEEEATVIAKFNSEGSLLNSAVSAENTTGVAVNASTGTVYLDNLKSLAAFGPTGLLIQNFGLGDLTQGAGIAVDAKANTVYASDPGSHRVEVFGPAAAGPPTVDSLSSQGLTPTSERLIAQVDPSGADTHAYFQYGTADCVKEPSACTSVPLPPGKDLGSGFGNVTTSVEVEGLQPATSYHFRIVATNDCGKAGETCIAEKAGILNTLPAANGLLADKRGWELVSPPEKDGASVLPPDGLGGNSGTTGGIMATSKDGQSVTYVTSGPPPKEEPQGNRALEGTQLIATRGEHAWASQDIVTPHKKAEGYESGRAQEYQFFSSDLSHAIVLPFANEFNKLQEPPLVPGVTEEERGIYLRNNTTCPTSCYQPLVNSENNTQHQPFGGKLHFISATPDLSHAVFRTGARLTAGAPENGGLYEWQSGGSLQLVSVLPNGTPAESGPEGSEETPELGWGNNEARNNRHAISEDGSHVVWTNMARDRLYTRDLTAGKTVQINKVFPEVKEEEEPEVELDEAFFQIASNDGSKVFFTDTARLTEESKLHPTTANSPADLYVFEPAGVGGCEKTAGCVTDLTSQSVDGPADVQSTVLGASEDGSYVYFMANGVLAPGAGPGNCSAAETPGAECSLYLAHLKGAAWETTFIARLSNGDIPEGLRNRSSTPLGRLAARVSPNGRYLAFMSQQPLTGYENIDATSKVRDEEVFLYDSATPPHLTCVSCNPGGPPHGVFTAIGHPLLVDGPETWRNRWIAANIPGFTPLSEAVAPYQSRYLSDQGRLFFNASDALVPQDKNGKMDVYQFEPSGVGSCEKTAGCVNLISSGTGEHESAFIDATPSGNDAFFITDQQLVPSSDTDHAYDLYDARVCTEASPCLKPLPPPPPPCASEEECRPPRTPAPASGGSAASATNSLPGNAGKSETRGEKIERPPPLTKKQKLERALRSCRKRFKHSKNKRHTCERRARHTYGNQARKPAKRGKR